MNPTARFPLPLAIALALASPAALAGGFYGGIELASSDPSGDRLPYGAIQTPYSSGDFVADEIGFGDGHRYGVHLGYEFSNRLFVELSHSRMDADREDSLGENPATDPAAICQVAPVQGFISDCYNEAVAGIEFRDESTQLILGRHFQPGERTTLSPYLGARQVRYEDDREIAYNYNGFGNPVAGFEVQLTDHIRFDDIGWVAGARLEHEFEPLFVRVDLSVAGANGDRERLIREIRTVADGPLADDSYASVEDITVRHRDALVGLGRDFDVSGNTMTVMLGYRYRMVDGVDTRNTNDSVFDAGSLGRSEGEVESHGMFLSLSFQQGQR